MPILTESVVLKNRQPNFERDSVKTLSGLKSAKPSHYDIGHIVYCQEDGNHYKYVGEKGNYSDVSGYFQLFVGSTISSNSEGLTIEEIEEILGK